MPARPKTSTTRQRAVAAGYRSGLEEIVSAQLSRLGVAFTYEGHVLRYEVPARAARYTPDFALPNGIVVETKGRWTAEDRQKIGLVRKQHPDLDLRLLFERDQRISKVSVTRYSDICNKLGLPFAVGKHVPQEWLDEPPNPVALAALARFRK